jgi:RNA polymerase sigma factor (sigma-70 family)
MVTADRGLTVAVGRCDHRVVDEGAKHRWVAHNILPIEREVRSWLRLRMRSLSAADIDDVIQESYARLWTLELSAIANPRAYFYQIARNLVHQRLRRARVVPMELMGEIDDLGVISDEPGPERGLSARQELDRLMSVVARLPPQCRRAFELRKFDGLSQREVAQRMGVSEGTVEKHLAKALAFVLQEIARLEERPHERVAKTKSKHGDGHGND